MEIPFKSLRYRPGREQIWDVQLRRAIRRKNEWTYLTQVPRSVTGGGGSGAGAVARVSRFGTLIGLEAPPASRALDIKPYAITGLTTDHTVSPVVSNGYVDAELDVKLGITESLFADFTLNTDFVQVEADEEQVNLTRFNLSFPEKREFFLEGQGVYQFAIESSSGGRGGGYEPMLFCSRRVGLVSGQVVPIQFGGRVTGKVGSFDVGAMSIQSGAHDALGIGSTNLRSCGCAETCSSAGALARSSRVVPRRSWRTGRTRRSG